LKIFLTELASTKQKMNQNKKQKNKHAIYSVFESLVFDLGAESLFFCKRDFDR
jgi:hypothetical protein